MYRYVMVFLSRTWKRLSQNSLRIREKNIVVQIPPSLFIPPSRERASYYRILARAGVPAYARTPRPRGVPFVVENQERTTTSENNVVSLPVCGIEVREVLLPGDGND